MAKITKRSVDALRPEDRERVVWDDDIKGFGVRVHPSGKKVYIVKYRHRGRAVKTTIGPHGPVTQRMLALAPQRSSLRRARAETREHMAATVRNLRQWTSW